MMPLHHLWQGIRAAFNVDVIVGCCRLTAPACFKAALCGRGGDGWEHHDAKTRKVYNLLCPPPDIMRPIVDRMRPEAPWVALTRDKTLTEEAQEAQARVRSAAYNLERNGLSGSAPGRMHSLVLG